METSDEISQSLEFYKKRYEIQAKQNLVIKEENSILRKELNNLKKLITDMLSPNEKKQTAKEKSNDNLRQILEFQHNRIESLEAENLEMKKKYEKILFDNEKQVTDDAESSLFEEKETKKEGRSKILFAKYSENSEEMKKANKTILMLENKLKELASLYAKEIIDLKAKLTTQTATMIINKKDNLNEFRVHSAELENKDLFFKKKDNLMPIDKTIMSSHKFQNKSMLESNNLFSYSKINNK